MSSLLTTAVSSGVNTSGSIRADNPGVKPNSDVLPGIDLLKDMVGGLLVGALIALLAALVISLVVWAFGSYSSNSHAAERGKKGVLISLVAALGVGGGNVLIGTFSDLGALL